MLRHFYIIYLLICIKYTICYDYYDMNSNLKYIDSRKGSQIGDSSKENRLLDDKDQVAQFDVAGFILNSDDETVEDDTPYAYRKRNVYNNYGSLTDEDIKEPVNVKMQGQDYLNSDHITNEAELQEASDRNVAVIKSSNTNASNYNGNGKSRDHKEKLTTHQDQVALDLVHNPEKKCSFRNMKFPFFSHNKSQTSKKQKKRKIFTFSNKKVENNSQSSLPLNNKYLPDLKIKKKRSYEGKHFFCPACGRKFKMKTYNDVDRKPVNNKILHNSRQFYAVLNEKAKDIADNVNFNNNNKDKYSDISIPIENDRRNKENTDDKEIRLKELTDIQKKLDEVNKSHLLKQN